MKGYRNRKLITKIALYLGLTFGVIWIFIFVVGGAFVEKEPISGVGILLTVIISLIIMSIILALWSEKRGGALVIVFSIILCIFAYVTAGRNKIFAMFISGVPFLISGIIFLIGDKIEQNK